VTEPFDLERLLWDLRHDPRVVAAVQREPVETMGAYGLSHEEIDALLARDFGRLLSFGVAPMLLYFGALEMGVSRDEYYTALAAQTRAEGAERAGGEQGLEPRVADRA
jgi:hypothetical protein